MTRQRGVDVTGDLVSDRNFARLDERVSELEDALLYPARLVAVSLASGDNRVRHGLHRARGRITVRLSAAVTLFDQDTAEPGVWVVNSSGAATATFLFF